MSVGSIVGHRKAQARPRLGAHRLIHPDTRLLTAGQHLDRVVDGAGARGLAVKGQAQRLAGRREANLRLQHYRRGAVNKLKINVIRERLRRAAHAVGFTAVALLELMQQKGGGVGRKGVLGPARRRQQAECKSQRQPRLFFEHFGRVERMSISRIASNLSDKPCLPAPENTSRRPTRLRALGRAARRSPCS